MVVLEELPIEIHHMIFGYLDLIQVCKCRLLSKKFNEIVKAFRVRELLVYSSNWYRRSSWFRDGKPIYPYNTVSNRKVSILSSSSIDLEYLKRLCFYGVVESDKFSLEVVNRLQHLVQLDLFFEVKGTGYKTKQLKLPSLEHLFIQFGFRVVVEFDAPRLESIILNYRPAENKAGQPTETIRFASTSTMKKSTASGLFPDE